MVERNYATLALEAANGKPVYPYVWERYHNSGLPIDLEPIPTQELYWHVEGAMMASVNGKRCRDWCGGGWLGARMEPSPR